MNFFSNSLIVLSGKECQTTSSLSGERTTLEDKFTVPIHTVGTSNLWIFVNGKILEPIRDYIDSNSYEVILTNEIATTDDFRAILIATGDESDKECNIKLKDSEF